MSAEELTSEIITKELQAAMKAGDKTRVSVLRLLSSSVRNAEVDKKRKLTPEEMIEVVSREVKRREEAASEFAKGNRTDRADVEKQEAEILREWLPEQLGEDQIRQLVEEAVAQTGASGPAEIGKVMAALMPKIKGRADGKVVSDLVRARLIAFC